MSLLSWLILGALVGWNISIVIKNNSEIGPLKNIIFGIIATNLIGLTSHYLAGVSIDQLNFPILFLSLFGASSLIFIIGARRD